MTTRFQCSGEAAAHDAGAHDSCQCHACRQFFPGGMLFAYPEGNLCPDCQDEREACATPITNPESK